MTDDQNDYVTNLQKEIESLKKDKQALASELNAPSNSNAADGNAAAIKAALVDKVPGYIANIHSLAEASDSESVRLSANKILIEWAVTEKLSTGDAEADADLKNLLKAIQIKAKQK